MHGMDDNEDDHNFSDDDFDSLPINALVELEQNAIRSTQPSQALNLFRAGAKQQSQPGNARHTLSHVNPHAQNHGRNQNWPLQPRPQPQYGHYNDDSLGEQMFEEENVATPVEEEDSFIHVPLKAPSGMSQREQWRQERLSKPHARQEQQNIPHNVQTTWQPARQTYQHSKNAESGYIDQNHHQAHDPMQLDQQPPPNDDATRLVQEEALRVQIEDLLRERETLATKLQAANSTVLTQKGEIAIIRANLGKESKTFERQLTSLKKSAEEEAARHKMHLENMLAESKKLATENQFLKHDLEDEVGRTTTLQRTLKEKPAAEKAGRLATTPQKTKAYSLRDGFEDGELMIVSPSKSGRRSKGGTPTAGAKRKRKVDVPSPVPPLVLRPSSGIEPPAVEEVEPAPEPERVVPIIRRDLTAEKNLQFIKRILNHRVAGEDERIVEALMKYAFPSEPSKSFTSIVLEAIAGLSGKRLSADLLEVFIDLWAKSLKEKYLKCISSLMDVVSFIIDLEISVVEIAIVQKLLPVLQASGEINGTTRFKNSPVSHQNLGKSRHTPQSELNSEVDGTVCLEMLYNLACICLDDEKRIDRFWRSMNMDFVLLMLNSSQPIPDITLMLNLLSTSILPQTFGMISSTAEEQAKMETWILDRICYLLWERPRADQGAAPPSKSAICKLRLEAMSLLNRLALASAPHPHRTRAHHGSQLLARHRSAIARLVRCIYDETDAMYQHSPSHALHAELVNQGVRLLYQLLQQQNQNQNHGNGGEEEAIDMQQKLQAINGGVHKHRVVLARLAFSEGSFLDAGITQRTVDMATDMLEEAVTPEEAESLVEAFPSYKGRRGTQS